jgi:hypothetical protein
MKIKDILGEDGDVTVKAVSGDQAELSNGQKIDAKTLTPDATHPGQFKAPEMDPNAIKPGAVVSMGDQQTSEEIGDDDEPPETAKHYHTWMHSEHSPHSDEADDEDSVFQKAIHFLSKHGVNPGDIEYHAHHMTKKFLDGMEEGHHDLISQGNHDVGGDATDSFIDQVRDKEFERKNRTPSGGNGSAISGKLGESDELMKWLTIAGIK